MEKGSLILRRAFRREVRLERHPPSAAMGEEAFMKTLISLKRYGDSYHFHPLHAKLSLLAGFVLAVLVVLILVSSAR